MHLRLIIFDCDGTLVDSQAVIILAMANAFARLGRAAPSAEAVRRIVGLSLPAAMSALVPEADAALADRLAQAYREAHPSAVAAAGHKDTLYPGARETLEALAASEFLLGIATGKGRAALNATLDPHGLLPFFTTFQTADRNASKPHPEMVLNAMSETGTVAADTVVIGDTSYDMAMAASAGAPRHRGRLGLPRYRLPARGWRGEYRRVLRRDTEPGGTRAGRRFRAISE